VFGAVSNPGRTGDAEEAELKLRERQCRSNESVRLQCCFLREELESAPQFADWLRGFELPERRRWHLQVHAACEKAS